MLVRAERSVSVPFERRADRPTDLFKDDCGIRAGMAAAVPRCPLPSRRRFVTAEPPGGREHASQVRSRPSESRDSQLCVIESTTVARQAVEITPVREREQGESRHVKWGEERGFR